MNSILKQSFCTDEGVFYSSHAYEGRNIDSNKNNVLKIKVQLSQYMTETGLDGSRSSRFPDSKRVDTKRSLYPQEIFLVFLSVRAGVDLRIIVRPE
jgi:hypothetical protein